MFYKNIADENVIEFHNTVKLTGSYSELNSISEKLFYTDIPMKLISLFYTDEIVGYSENLTIIDDLIVLYADEGLLNQLYFNSEDNERTFDLNHNIETVNGKHYLKLHFYDRTSLFSLSSFQFKITQTDGITGDYATDLYGNCIIQLNSVSGSFTIVSETLNQNVVFEED